MTHDELLELCASETYRESRTLEHPYIALRAVIELHKPCEPVSNDKFVTCETCNYEYHREYPWPCETIEAIERELK